MGVKDLKNYVRKQSYLRQDQCKFISQVADLAAGQSGKKIKENDIVRFAIDLIMNRKPEHDQDIRKALGMIQAGLISTQVEPAAPEELAFCDDNGLKIIVSRGIDRSEWWGVFRAKSNGIIIQRLKNIPMETDKKLVEIHLIKYAQKKKWQTWEEYING